MSVNHQIDGGSGEFKDGERNEQKKVIGYGRKARKVVWSKIKKAKKRLQGNKTQKNESSGFCWCIGRVRSLDSASDSPTSDPNSSGFGFDSLIGLIEKSDFLLDDCNTHFDVYITDDGDHDVDEYV
ncbi:hypothetical protein L1987_15139 [Smallanthus sonchifolius]|uniref:Uncharacterized protein n=1 Tax=Smallanthus sonchifolius TaxID=185202 RepID=A0ACB9J6X2_9ASTR|nr:hypothetical protein L1987_15139 [Smallanthus sonchifolius]